MQRYIKKKKRQRRKPSQFPIFCFINILRKIFHFSGCENKRFMAQNLAKELPFQPIFIPEAERTEFNPIPY